MQGTMQLKTQRGQNTAEYLIMLTLVAIGSIGLMTAFGKTIQSKIAYVSAAISGDVEQYNTAQTQTKNAASRANAKAGSHGDIKMEGIAATELQDN